MAETVITPEQQPEPELHKRAIDPRGVLQKNMKPLLYCGVALLVILAAIFSSHSKKTPAEVAAANHLPPQPAVQDNTDNNIQDLKNQLQAERQKEADQIASQQATMNDPSLAIATPAQRAAVAGLNPSGQPNPCIPGQPCPQAQPYGYSQGAGGGQNQTAEEQASHQLAAKERERAYEARFSSNLVYAHQPEQANQTQGSDQSKAMPPGYVPQQGSSLVTSRSPGEQAESQSSTAKRPPEVNIDSATGQPYVIYEGATIDTVLMNRLDGDAVGPVKVLVSNPVYSHDHQHVLIPEGTIVLGEAKKIGSAGFGQQRRMAVVFHRMIMPDGYSVDLDQFNGLDQIGEEGLKDKVNNHYLQIFGASIVLGVIAGAAQISSGGGALTGSGPQVFTNGASASVSQSATTILDRFMQIPPTITIREGHRVKVYVTQDMLLPAYENHTIPQSF
jgi:type IV secretory pathway VirB10-like protein